VAINKTIITAVLAAFFLAGGPSPANAEPGFIGMQVQGMSPRVAAALGLKSSHGVLIRDVALQGPAAKAGFRRGDLIVTFAGKPVQSFEHLVKVVQTIMPGEDVAIGIMRLGKNLTLTLKAGNWIDSWRVKKGSFVQIPERGITLAAITPKVRERFGVRWGSTGVVITLVDKEKALGLDLQRGEVIRQVNQQEVWKPRQVLDAYVKAKQAKKASLLLLVEGVNGFRFSLLKVGERAAAKK